MCGTFTVPLTRISTPLLGFNQEVRLFVKVRKSRRLSLLTKKFDVSVKTVAIACLAVFWVAVLVHLEPHIDRQKRSDNLPVRSPRNPTT